MPEMMDAALPEVDKAIEPCKIFNCTLDSLFREDMDKRDSAYTNLRMEEVEGFRYVTHTVISTDPEGNAQAGFKLEGVERIYFYCNRSGLFYLNPIVGIDDRESGYDDSEERRELEKTARMLFG